MGRDGVVDYLECSVIHFEKSTFLKGAMGLDHVCYI